MENIPIYNNLNLNGNEIRNFSLEKFSVAPIDVFVGRIFLNTTDNCIYYYDTTNRWVNISSFSIERNFPIVSGVPQSLNFDWNNNFHLIARKQTGGGIDISGSVTISLSNLLLAESAQIFLNVTADVILTFPAIFKSKNIQFNNSTKKLYLGIGEYKLNLIYDGIFFWIEFETSISKIKEATLSSLNINDTYESYWFNTDKNIFQGRIDGKVKNISFQDHYSISSSLDNSTTNSQTYQLKNTLIIPANTLDNGTYLLEYDYYGKYNKTSASFFGALYINNVLIAEESMRPSNTYNFFRMGSKYSFIPDITIEHKIEQKYRCSGTSAVATINKSVLTVKRIF